MQKQRVTRKSGFKSPSRNLKVTTSLLFVSVSILMTGSTAYLYKMGLDPVEFYSNLANPYMRLVNIPAGLRREQIVQKFAEVLDWHDADIAAFIKTAPSDDRGFLDGYYLPGAYWVKTGATGDEVAHMMLRKFNSEVGDKILSVGAKASAKAAANISTGKNAPVDAKKINLDTAVRIASIIQREAAGPSDMNIISGVIWNRMFKGMSLDMDATLQYVKASESMPELTAENLVDSATSTVWWPKVKSQDKYIDSPFNTYQNKGLPPMAIANPSLAAIKAAFNPAKTDCLFYIHDSNGSIHCSKTYDVHKNNVQKYLVGKK